MGGRSGMEPFMHEIQLPSGLVLKEPQLMIKLFMGMAYLKYDAAEIRQDNNLGNQDIRAANLLNDRTRQTAQAALLRKRRSINGTLTQVLSNLDLPKGGENSPVWQNIQKLLAVMRAVDCVGLASATNVWHKKRPRLIPVLDAIIQQYYRQASDAGHLSSAPISDFSYEAGLGVWLTGCFRQDLLSCEPEIIRLCSMLRTLGAELTPVRVLEALIWAEREQGNSGRGYYRRQRDWLLAEPGC